MNREEEVRKKVKVLKRFYTDVIYFGIVTLILTLIWLTFDRTGSFWPKYVIVIWGIALIFKAYRMGVAPFMFHRVPFFNQDWEEKKVKEIMRRRQFHHKPPSDGDSKEK
ncbi:MAG: 2TM domain-containing protein [Alphaproteobacteria bacterium]|nr:2TM domain-containing protein [Alphaproteobacteria bacterium]